MPPPTVDPIMPVDLLVSEIGDSDRADIAVRAEELGYDSVWVGELWGTSAVVELADVARRTERVGIGTAVLNVFSRSPAVLAMTAATLDRKSAGRFRLGVGVSSPKAVEDLHGAAFERPIRRAHETIELVRAFTAGDGDPVSYDGELFDVADFTALDADVPIYHAGLGDASRRVVGRLCDGWIPHNVPFSKLDDAFEAVAAAAKSRDRDPDRISVTPYVPAAVCDERTAALDAVRRHVAYYVGSADGYRDAVAMRFPAEADRIAEAWRAGDRRRAVDAVTDEMVRDLGVAGAPDEARSQLRAIRERPVVDRPIVVIPAPAAAALGETTVEALAPRTA